MKTLYTKYQKAIQERVEKNVAQGATTFNNPYQSAFHQGAKFILEELSPQMLLDYAEMIRKKTDPDLLVEEFIKKESEPQ